MSHFQTYKQHRKMMKSMALFGAVAIASKFDDLVAQQEFATFVKTYKKQYAADEVLSKFITFKNNMELIKNHPSDSTFTMAMNEFSDLTAIEFSGLYKGYSHRNNAYARSRNAHVKPANQVYADSLDWNAKGTATTTTILLLLLLLLLLLYY